MDLGECTKIHDLALRADYEIASKERDLFFELDVRFFWMFIYPCCKESITIESSVMSVSYKAK